MCIRDSALLDGPYTQTGAQAAAAATGRRGGPNADALTGIFRDPYLDAPPDASLAVLMLRDAAVDASTSLTDAAGADPNRVALADAVVAVARESGIRVSDCLLYTSRCV